jgi:hypothetical protein
MLLEDGLERMVYVRDDAADAPHQFWRVFQARDSAAFVAVLDPTPDDDGSGFLHWEAMKVFPEGGDWRPATEDESEEYGPAIRDHERASILWSPLLRPRARHLDCRCAL